MKDTRIGVALRRQLWFRAATLAALLLALIQPMTASADSVLLSDSNLVSGSQSSVFSFEAPGPGTVSVQITNVAWPQTLNSLSFVATTANHVLSSWSMSGAPPPTSTSQTLFFQVASGGSYFADVAASAGGPLDLGVYSLSVTFAPATSPVPLPGAAWLLLAGIMALLALSKFAQQRPAPSPAI